MALPLKNLIVPSWCPPERVSTAVLSFASRRPQERRAQCLPGSAELLASWILAAASQVTKPALLPLLKEGSQPWPCWTTALAKSGPPVLATVDFGWLCKTPSVPSAAVGFWKCPALLQQLGWNQTHFMQNIQQPPDSHDFWWGVTLAALDWLRGGEKHPQRPLSPETLLQTGDTQSKTATAEARVMAHCPSDSSLTCSFLPSHRPPLKIQVPEECPLPTFICWPEVMGNVCRFPFGEASTSHQQPPTALLLWGCRWD